MLASLISRTAALSTIFLTVKRLIALSFGTQREQLEQRMKVTWPRPFLLRPPFLLFFVYWTWVSVNAAKKTVTTVQIQTLWNASSPFWPQSVHITVMNTSEIRIPPTEIWHWKKGSPYRGDVLNANEFVAVANVPTLGQGKLAQPLLILKKSCHNWKIFFISTPGQAWLGHGSPGSCQ